MSEAIVNSGPSQLLDEQIRVYLQEARPRVVGIVSAFVTVDGVTKFANAMKRLRIAHCRLVAGTSHYITHPNALEEAKKLGWKVRFGKLPPAPGIFHPKVTIGGDRFHHDGRVVNPCFVCIGSANLTGRGLSANTECGIITTGDDCATDASATFREYWLPSTPVDTDTLGRYSAEFAERSRRRSTSALDQLGVSEDQCERAPAKMRKTRVPRLTAVGAQFAVAAWTGLESFTGGYAFQVEFPKAAGQVVRRLIGRRRSKDGYVQVFCEDENTMRRMQFRFYEDNSMFRLNIPNDTAGVAWARQNKKGVALLEQGPAGGAPLRLRILEPGDAANEIVSRSYALGTWGKTPKRLYGWY